MMHRALWIDEIICEILIYLDLRGLLPLVCLCKAFHQPVLDALWSQQGSLQSLTSLLPEDLVVSESLGNLEFSVRDESYFHGNLVSIVPWRMRIPGISVDKQEYLEPDADPQAIRPINLDQRVCIFERSPTLEDIWLFRNRTARSKRILYTVNERKAFLVVNALIRIFPSIHFFPNLMELEIAASTSWYYPPPCLPIPFSLLHKVRNLIVSMIEVPPPGPSPGQAVFKDLMASGPYLALERVEFRSNRIKTHARISRRAFDFLYQLLNQNSATIRFLQLASVELDRLQDMLALEELDIGQYYEYWAETTPPADSLILQNMPIEGEQMYDLDIAADDLIQANVPNPTIELPSLLSIKCHGRAVSSSTFASVLHRLRSPNLKRVVFEDATTSFDAESVVSLVHNISVAGVAPDLEHLHLDLGGPQIKEPESISDSLQTTGLAVNNLKLLSKLEHVYIRCPATVSLALDDGSIMDMARALPHIKHLWLDPTRCTASKVTLEGLIPLAQHCVQLETLGIGLDPIITHVVYASTMYEHALGAGHESALVTLDIGAPLVQDVLLCAEFLRYIFPSHPTLLVPAEQTQHLKLANIYAWSKVAHLAQSDSNDAGGSEKQASVEAFLEEDDAEYYRSSEEEDGEDYEDSSSD